MTIRPLFPILLVLLQAGFAAAHGHAHSDPARNCGGPHLHLCELLALFGPSHGGDGDHDEDGHDNDAVNLADLLAPAAPPAVEFGALDLAPAGMGPAFEAPSGPLSFPVGLPPSTAGPNRPLYLTFCAITI